MTAIHLLDRHDNVRKPDRSKNEWESGYWEVTEEEARKLIGSALYLHRAKLHGAHFGGSILDYYIADSGPEAGRVVFKVRADADRKGVKTDAKCWRKNYKIFWDAPVPAEV